MYLGHFQAIDKGSDVLTNFEWSEDTSEDALEHDRGLLEASGIFVFAPKE